MPVLLLLSDLLLLSATATLTLETDSGCATPGSPAPAGVRHAEVPKALSHNAAGMAYSQQRQSTLL